MPLNLSFWFFAGVVFVTAIATAATGWWSARRRDLETHRRRMSWAIGLLLLFVACYLAKLLLLGREDLSGFSTFETVVLRVHETLIGLMLFSGGMARGLARAAGASRPPRLPAATARRHRFWGRCALVSGGLALLTAALVLRALSSL